MTAAPATLDDLDWMIDLLAERRAPLVDFAPVFWRPAPQARAAHRTFIAHVVTDGGGRAYRTADAVLIAAPRGDGWLVDDAFVRGEQWLATPDGGDLWNALAGDCAGSQVRFVCPTYETQRAAFATEVGLAVQESWWLLELTGGGGEAGLTVSLPGAYAVTLAAPPVYAPPGPMLFLPNPVDASIAIPAALERAVELGCAGVVVNQAAYDHALAEQLAKAGFRRHCDYFSGEIRPLHRAG